MRRRRVRDTKVNSAASQHACFSHFKRLIIQSIFRNRSRGFVTNGPVRIRTDGGGGFHSHPPPPLLPSRRHRCVYFIFINDKPTLYRMGSTPCPTMLHRRSRGVHGVRDLRWIDSLRRADRIKHELQYYTSDVNSNIHSEVKIQNKTFDLLRNPSGLFSYDVLLKRLT